jgi:hypothetical protein
MFSINCKLSCGSVSDVLRARTAHDHAWNALLRESASTNHGCLGWCDACKPVGGNHVDDKNSATTQEHGMAEYKLQETTLDTKVNVQ